MGGSPCGLASSAVGSTVGSAAGNASSSTASIRVGGGLAGVFDGEAYVDMLFGSSPGQRSDGSIQGAQRPQTYSPQRDAIKAGWSVGQ
eukprot:1391493-Amorphochlora_amoeboformis.AAC.2